ncbi:serine protease [Microbispora sp. NPDC046973]|uniref:trypsin-like serine peptidase n=1 Tax=Microbispora sp. NPDC046973 TaxID=3155022 RepID=UPI0033FF1762
MRRLVPDLEHASALLENPGDVLAARPERDRRVRSRRAPGPGAAAGRPIPTSLDALHAGRRALRKVLRTGENAQLDEAELIGLEAVVVTLGRPAILVQDDHFFPAPHPWEVLEDHRAAIEGILPSVGRIEVSGHPALDWIGTGFLVDTDAVLTNKHVVREFVDWRSGGTWTIDPSMRVRIDFAEEIGTPYPREFPVTSIIGIHSHLDLALLRVGANGTAGRLPPPLPLARSSAKLTAGRQVYVVGYPAADSRRNDEGDIQRIFSDIFNVKRLQPGELRSVAPNRDEVAHDCSTLGGNSGSCLVDLESQEVIGVHYRGRYLEANWAVAMHLVIEQIFAATRGRR